MKNWKKEKREERSCAGLLVTGLVRGAVSRVYKVEKVVGF